MDKQIESNTMLNVLCLEDSLPDAELMRETLEEAGFRMRMSFVSTEKEFVASLKEQKTDIILADYNLPGFNATEALNHAKKICPSIPFVCVSGAIGEDTTVELLKNGATDYVSKDRLTRLPHVVKRALKEAAEKQDRQKAEEALKESHKRYAELSNSITDIFFAFDKDLRYIFWNKASEDLTKISAKDAIGKHFYDLFPETPSTRFAEAKYREALSTGLTQTFINEYIIEENTYFFEISIYPSNEGITVFTRDITERKNIEEKLRESEEHFRRIFNDASIPMALLNNSFHFTHVNAAFISYLGYPEDELTKLTFADISDPEYLTKDFEQVKRLMKGEIPVYRTEKRYITRQKEWAWGLVQVSVLTSNSGNFLSFLVMIDNITDRKNSEEALLESEKRARALLDAIPDLMFRLDRTGTYLDYKAGLEDLYYQSGTIIGKRNRDITPPAFADFLESKIHDSLENGGMEIFEYQLPVPDKGMRDFEARMMASGPDEVIAIARDITERKKVDNDVKYKNEQLERINAEKDKFFSIIAHDLRSPFNALLGFSELLAEGVAKYTLAELQNMANRMHASATNLFKLLENLLEWSRIQRGMVQFEPNDCSLSEIIKDNANINALQADNKKVQIICSIPPDTEVYADCQMLNSIIRNLLSNAIKFSDKGGIVSISAQETRENEMEISIKDSGIGMSKEMKETLFSPGVDNSRKGTEGEPSTGLGLLLCKEYVGHHGGKIWVESEDGKGSTFYFTLPPKSKRGTSPPEE